jgi:two-component system, cell cycle sensor histidine kinase and response regulator CckA
VAHDFNNLLGPLVGYPYLIKMQLPPGHRALQYCGMMQEAAQQMAAINEDLLTLARRGVLKPEPVEINRITIQAAEDACVTSAGVQVELDLEPEIPPVSGSGHQLLRVANNLISNAVQSLRGTGMVVVKTASVYVDRPFGRYTEVQIGEYVKLEVADNGCGIPMEVRERIFEPFFTTKKADRRRGSGLGLSVVRAIVEDHKGYIDFESRAGMGTTFSVYLPVSRQAVAEAPVGDAPHGTETILIVDDDRMQMDISRGLLEALGYQVEAAECGEKALDWLQDHQADLLLLDMVMPDGIDGTETYRRALEIRPGQRAIVSSGFAESERHQAAEALGAGPYLRKPVKLEALARAVRRGLDRS